MHEQEILKLAKALVNGDKVDSHGIIRSPGKFEGEYWYAPYFYDAILNGEGEYLADGTLAIKLTKAEKLAFNIDVNYVAVYESDQGFVFLEERDQ